MKPLTYLAIVGLFLNPSSGQAETSPPLSGQIWSVKEASFVSFADMLADLVDEPYILVGERHGRTAHQGREAFLIGALAEAGRYPSIAFEMLDHSQTALVAQYRQKEPEYTLGLGIELEWAQSDWPAWSFYHPVFDMAFATKAKIIGADLTDLEQNEVVADSSRPSPLNQPSFSYYQTNMSKAHCGLIDEPRAQELARMQIARDQQMAKNLLPLGASDSGGLLVVGSSHIRKSTGIPQYLPADETVVVSLVETDAETANFLTPFQDIVSGELSDFDYIWFTPKIAETSFCDRIGGSGNAD